MAERPQGDPPTDSRTTLAEAERDAALRRFEAPRLDEIPGRPPGTQSAHRREHRDRALEGAFVQGRQDPSRRGARVARHRTNPRRRRGGAHRPSPLGDPVPPGGRDRGDSPRRSRAMSSSSLSICRSPVLANAAFDSQAALSSSRFAMSPGGGSSSSPSISADWHRYSSHSVLMHENVARISVARHSMSSSAAGAIGGATASRGKVGIAVMGGSSRGCAAGFARRSWRPDAGNIRSPHFTVRVLRKRRGGTRSARCAGVLATTDTTAMSISPGARERTSCIGLRANPPESVRDGVDTRRHVPSPPPRYIRCGSSGGRRREHGDRALEGAFVQGREDPSRRGARVGRHRANACADGP